MSKFLWHTLSADHEIDGLIPDVIRHTVNTGTKKRDLIMLILGGNLTGTSGSLQQKVLLSLTSLFFPLTRLIHYNQERIKGKRKASPIHTLFHR